MMMRAAIQRDDLSLPASEDFVAAFGCDVEFDEQTHTECYAFTDSFKQISKMWIGTADRTFSLSIARDGAEIVRVYDERLSSIRLDEGRQMIVVTLGDDSWSQRLELSVWPRIKVAFTQSLNKN
ncbi:hypothetical protein [Chelativorans alearense]|uniref:hypothetical protein n=1 Tax=Chelativorans alearense TaxID=2681495 RepID=UPI0013D1D600|nr:hypothetical protein [Chelativorans alearense]